MLIKPFANLHLAPTPPEDETYLGVIVDNNDPKKLGRVRVWTDVYEDIDLDSIPWATPLLNTFLGNSVNAISFSVPEVGSQVRISFPTKDIYAPYYSGCEINEENKCTFFDDDYPNCYGSKDSTGNFIKINKRTKEVTIQHSSTLNLQVAEDGTAMITNPKGTSITLDSAGNIGVENAKFIQSECVEYQLYANTMMIDTPNATFSGNLTVNGTLNPINGVSAVVPLQDGTSLVFSNGILTSRG